MAKCRLYLIGLQHFTLTIDHRPLIPILNHYTLDAIENPRIQRFKEKVTSYNFTVVWRAGKQLCIPDALSRAPVSCPSPEDEEECTTMATHVRHIVTHTAMSTDDQSLGPIIEDDRTLQEIRTAATQDPAYIRLLSYISNGFPTSRYDLHASALPYWKLWNSLYTDGELMLYGPRIVIPAALCQRTLACLNDSNRGIEATRHRARQTVFWPGIDADIKSTVEACESYQQLLPSQQQEPYMCDDHPTQPFDPVSADFLQVAGKSFLIIADRLSGWPVVASCRRDTSAAKVTNMFFCYFHLRNNSRPPFSSHEFKCFTNRWGVHHLITSLYRPQSNGHAEAAVKSTKHLILKTAQTGNIDCEEFDRGLLELRNTPTPAGHSPAQILYGRPLRTCVPAHPVSFSDELQAKAEECDRRAAAQAD